MVDGDAQGLERARGRVHLLRLAVTDRSCYQFNELLRRFYRLAPFSPFNDSLRDAA